jgi:hypothetical protein
VIQLYQSNANAELLRTAVTDADVVRWLVSGGDERIALNELGRNRYGCSPAPESCATGFSSSTASTISTGAFEAARERLGALLASASVREAYEEGVADIRRRLAELCGLPPDAADSVVLAASGTDLHLIAADLARGDRSRHLLGVMAEPSETGRGVANALCSRRYAAASPHGAPAVEGQRLDEAPGAALVSIPLREVDGAVRDAGVVDAAFEEAVGKAMTARGAVLLVLLDVSKTGLVAPTADCAVRLKQRYGEALTVMVDACQFRLAPESLRSYLAEGFLVAVTGSKFVGGPPFSGALILPPGDLERLHRAPLAPALGDYCARADWPGGFIARSVLPDAQNFGLLLRWEAALHELEAFRRIPADRLCFALEQIAAVAEARLASPAFEALAAPRLRRFGRDGWDVSPTLFPFLARGRHGLLTADQTQALYQGLSDSRILLGQPVPVGHRDGQPISALRLAISASQLVQAADHPDGPAALACEIQDTLDVVQARAAALG